GIGVVSAVSGRRPGTAGPWPRIPAGRHFGDVVVRPARAGGAGAADRGRPARRLRGRRPWMVRPARAAAGPRAVPLPRTARRSWPGRVRGGLSAREEPDEERQQVFET